MQNLRRQPGQGGLRLQSAPQRGLPVQQPLSQGGTESGGCGPLVLQPQALPLGIRQAVEFIEVEHQAFAGVIQQLPDLGHRVLGRLRTELAQGINPGVAEVEQALAQTAQPQGEGSPPLPLGCLIQGLLQGVAQIHQQLEQALALLQPGRGGPKQAQAQQGHQDAEGRPEQAQRDPAVELLLMGEPA